MKILVVQNSAKINDKEYNYRQVENLLSSRKRERGVDLIVLPEVWSNGWKCCNFRNDAENWEKYSPTIDFLRKIAIEFSANVVGGSIIRSTSEGIKNSMPVLNREGNLIGIYDKMHLYSYLGDNESSYVEIGKRPKVVCIDGVTIGLSICYDLRFPELYRCYALSGVQLLINVASWPKSRKNHWDVLTKARAIENQAFLVAVSQCGEIENGVFNLGNSRVVNPLGEIVKELGDREEGTMMCDIDFSEMEALRENVKTLKDVNPNGYMV